VRTGPDSCGSPSDQSLNRRHFGDNVGVTYDTASLEPRSTFLYPGDGWGLTHDDHRLIMGDGSSRLRYLDPETLVELGRFEVVDGDKRVGNLNELEFVEGKIYANVCRRTESRSFDRIPARSPAG